MFESIKNFIIDNSFSLGSVIFLVDAAFASFKRGPEKSTPENVANSLIVSLIALAGFIQEYNYRLFNIFIHISILGIGLSLGYYRIVLSKFKFTQDEVSRKIHYNDNLFGLYSLLALIFVKILLKEVLPMQAGVTASLVSNLLLTFSSGTLIGRRIYIMKKYFELKNAGQIAASEDLGE